MNTQTQTTGTPANTKAPAPFAALIEFKPEYYLYGKHQSYVYRCDKFTHSSNPYEQYKVLEILIEKEYRNMFRLATIFNNNPDVKNKVVWQVSENFVHVDNRAYMGFLSPTIDENYLMKLQHSFTKPIDHDKAEIQHLLTTQPQWCAKYL